jgi:predicted transcriptional regulator of viral defense system
MMGFIIALVMAIFAVGVPTGITIHEKEQSVNKTIVECIEKPNICKMRYEYMKLGEKLNEIELDKLVEKQK